MEQVTHHGRETAYRWRGDGGDGSGGDGGENDGSDPVLFVHGSGGSHASWTPQFRLAEERPVVALDLSGHGASDEIAAEPGYETLSAYVDDVVAVVEETDATALCGHSLGGAVVMSLVLEREFDPETLVLVGTGARLSVLNDLLEWLRSDFERAIEFLHAPDRLFHDPTDELVTASRQALAAAGRATVERDFRTAHGFDVRDRLDELDVPALAVVGEYDRLTPPWYHEELAEGMPDCEWTTVDDTAHLPMLERPSAFGSVLREFLA